MDEWQERWKSGSTGEFFRKINPEVGQKITYTDSNRQKEITIYDTAKVWKEQTKLLFE